MGSTGESSPCCHAAFRWVTKMKVQLLPGTQEHLHHVLASREVVPQQQCQSSMLTLYVLNMLPMVNRLNNRLNNMINMLNV